MVLKACCRRPGSTPSRLHASDTTPTVLSYKKIGDGGARGQGKALAGSGSINSLDLCACGITADGAAHLAEGVGKSESLATLTLHGNMIGGARGQGR